MTYWLSLGKYGELGRDKHFPFCSDYNVPTLFEIYKWDLGMWHSLNTLPTMVHGQIFHINITTPYPLTGDAPCEPSSVFGTMPIYGYLPWSFSNKQCCKSFFRECNRLCISAYDVEISILKFNVNIFHSNYLMTYLFWCPTKTINFFICS